MGKVIRKKLSEIEPTSQTEIDALKALKDEEIDYSDISETDEGFWKGAKFSSSSQETGEHETRYRCD